MADIDISSLSVASAQDALRRGDFTSVELTQSVLDAIAAKDGAIGAYLTVDADGALAGAALPFPNKGIDFAMTALFLVILTDQCRERKNRVYAAVGLLASIACALIFGAGKMLIPSMVLMLSALIVFRKPLGKLESWKPGAQS